MAFPINLLRYTNWKLLFEGDLNLEKCKKEWEKPVEIIKWSPWVPVSKGSFIEGYDFETQKNRKMFFIMSGHPLTESYIIV